MKAFSLIFTLTCSTLLCAQNSLFGGFVDGADLLIHMEAGAFNQAPIIKAMEGLAGNNEEEKKEITRKMEEATGLKEDDMEALTFSMDLAGIDFENQDPAQMAKVEGLMALQFKKAITIDQLEAGIRIMAEQRGPSQVNVAQQDREGTQTVVITPVNPEENGPKEVLATLSADGKSVLFGFNEGSLQNGLKRIADQKIAAASPEMANALRALKGQQFRIAVVLPPELQKELSAPTSPVAQMPLKDLQAVLIGVNAGQALDLNVKLDLKNEQNVQGLVAMAGMMLPAFQQQAQGMMPAAAGLMQKLKIVPQTPYVSISLNVTEEDVNGLMDMMGGMQGGMPMPMP